jgi:hypothetical protein
MREQRPAVRLDWLPIAALAILVAPGLSLALVAMLEGSPSSAGYWLLTVGVPALLICAGGIKYLGRVPVAVLLGLVAAGASVVIQALAWSGVR